MTHDNKTERYYWLKMGRKFMDRHDIKILRAMGGPDKGARLVLFYISLLLESIDHNGYLRYDEKTPYNETMLAAVTGEELELVKDAMTILEGPMHLIERLDDGTLHLTKLGDMVGSETAWAKKKREYRESKKEEVEETDDTEAGEFIIESEYTEAYEAEDSLGQSPDNLGSQSDKSKRQSKSKSIEKDIDNKKENITKEKEPEKYSDEWAEAIKERMRKYN